MKKEMSLDQMKLEIAADKDVRMFIEALQHWYDEKREKGEITNKSVSETAGIDASFLSRVINGRAGNPNLKTIAKIFRAMDLRVCPNIVELSKIENARTNYCASQAFDDARSNWKIAFHGGQGKSQSALDHYISIRDVKHVQFIFADDTAERDIYEMNPSHEKRAPSPKPRGFAVASGTLHHAE